DDLRPAVRVELEARAEAADDRSLRDLALPARLHLHPAPRPQIPRRPAGHDPRRHRLLEALDGARRAGQAMTPFVEEFAATDDKTFVLRLKEPFGFVETALAISAGTAPVIMREKDALTDPFKNITETIG